MKPMSMTMPRADDAPLDRLVCAWAKMGAKLNALVSNVIFICYVLP